MLFWIVLVLIVVLPVAIAVAWTLSRRDRPARPPDPGVDGPSFVSSNDPLAYR